MSIQGMNSVASVEFRPLRSSDLPHSAEPLYRLARIVQSMRRQPPVQLLAQLAQVQKREDRRRCAALLNLRGFRHAAVEGAEHQVLLTVSIEAQADERCSVELLSAILALNRALHPDG
jgi:hypothetical protein